MVPAGAAGVAGAVPGAVPMLAGWVPVGAPVAPGSVVGLPVCGAVPVPPGRVSGPFAAAPVGRMARTGRKRIWLDCSSARCCSWEILPGTVTTTFVPSVLTSASATP